MSIPAFSVPRPSRDARALALSILGALAASATGTLLAVLAAVVAWWDRSGNAAAVGVAVIGTAAAPAIALVLYGMNARAPVRIVAGGFAVAPSIAVTWLFEAPGLVPSSDLVIAAALALLAGGAALGAWRLEKRRGLIPWWILAGSSLAMLWATAAALHPAQVWVEAPWQLLSR